MKKQLKNNSVMDYESKYNELVEAARAVVEGNPGLCNIDERLIRLSKLLPEKDSEDKRIMNEIIFLLKHYNSEEELTTQDTIDSMIAYLENKKKQPTNSEKPKEWSEEDKHRLEQAINALGRNGYYVLVNWLQFLPERFNPQPKQEQPEVDLEKEMKEYFGEDWKDGTPIEVQDDMIQFARHFLNRGLNARKEE